jgi:hypothetical protein
MDKNDKKKMGLALLSYKKEKSPPKFNKELMMKQLILLPMSKTRKGSPQKTTLVSSLQLVLD